MAKSKEAQSVFLAAKSLLLTTAESLGMEDEVPIQRLRGLKFAKAALDGDAPEELWAAVDFMMQQARILLPVDANTSDICSQVAHKVIASWHRGCIPKK